MVAPDPPPMVKVHHVRRGHDPRLLQRGAQDVARGAAAQPGAARKHAALWRAPRHVGPVQRVQLWRRDDDRGRAAAAARRGSKKRCSRCSTTSCSSARCRGGSPSRWSRPSRPTSASTYFLKEQLKQINEELGLEHDDKDALLSKFQAKLDLLDGGAAREQLAREAKEAATAKEAEAEAKAAAAAARRSPSPRPVVAPRPAPPGPAAPPPPEPPPRRARSGASSSTTRPRTRKRSSRRRC